MTTQTAIQPQIIVTEHNVAEHVHNIHVLKSAIRESQKLLYEETAAVIAYMEADEAKVWTDGRVKATKKPGDPVYSVDGLRAALGEFSDAETMAKLIVHGEQCKKCEGSGGAPDRVDGTFARVLYGRGARYKDALDRNCVRSDPTLSVEEVKP